MSHLEAGAVRSALRNELQKLGYAVARDTAGSSDELYIQGDGDRAAALFEFKTNADEAAASMYQGSWLPSLPPRFAVLPAAEKSAPSLEFLEQAGLSVLFYEVADGRVTFVEFESALDEIARRRAGAG